MAKLDPLALYERLVATIPEVERKGDKVPYTSVNGHMFSNLTKDGTLSLRLPEDVRAAFLAKYKAKLAVEYGIVRKEYVAVPAALLAKTAEVKPYFAKSYAWVKAMKPKPTKRKTT
jgi:TfoX/Sxy family transcriptional regulator of competence genes